METTFDPREAAKYAAFVDAAYAMYGGDRSDAHPPPILVPGYELVAYVTMRDFIRSAGDQAPSFYGFIAASSDASEYVLALRGTDDAAELYADLHVDAVAFAAVPEAGSVVAGFAEIYETMHVEPVASSSSIPGVDPAARFADAVAGAVRAHRANAGNSERALPVELPPRLVVAGHSLGAALATLFVMESAYRNATLAAGAPKYFDTPGVYTFGSPAVGNAAFVQLYASYATQQSIATWRIVNTADVVPALPPAILGWRQAGTEEAFDSHDSIVSLRHAHLMSTYEQLLAGATS